jgi:hypothetical protein
VIETTRENIGLAGVNIILFTERAKQDILKGL